MVKVERNARILKNIDHKVDLCLDYVRTGENVPRPIGWPEFPLKSSIDFLEWEQFLENKDHFDFAVSFNNFNSSIFLQ